MANKRFDYEGELHAIVKDSAFSPTHNVSVALLRKRDYAVAALDMLEAAKSEFIPSTFEKKCREVVENWRNLK